MDSPHDSDYSKVLVKSLMEIQQTAFHAEIRKKF